MEPSSFGLQARRVFFSSPAKKSLPKDCTVERTNALSKKVAKKVLEETSKDDSSKRSDCAVLIDERVAKPTLTLSDEDFIPPIKRFCRSYPQEENAAVSPSCHHQEKTNQGICCVLS